MLYLLYILNQRLKIIAGLEQLNLSGSCIKYCRINYFTFAPPPPVKKIFDSFQVKQDQQHADRVLKVATLKEAVEKYDREAGELFVKGEIGLLILHPCV